MILRLIFFTIVFLLIIVLTQDIQIFPRTILPSANKNFFPEDVAQHFVTTSDNKRLETWFMDVDQDNRKPFNVIIFHGNGDNLETTYQIQAWLKHLGYPSISFDYRGYRNSSGWPSERGLYLDSEAVWKHAEEAHLFTPETTILFGSSIGAAPALQLATKIHPKALVLLSPFTSLTDLVSEHPLFKYLVYFLWYEFPNARMVEQLTDTSILLAHGKRDTIIPYEHGKKIFSQYKGSGKAKFIAADHAGHNDLLAHSNADIAVALEELLNN